MTTPEYLVRVLDVVDRVGWAVQGILGKHPLCYTVGLTPRGWPELVTVGMHHLVAQPMLNRIVRQQIEADRCFTVDELITVESPTRPLLQLRDYPTSAPKLVIAEQLYGHRAARLPALQVHIAA